MSTIDTLCALVELETVNVLRPDAIIQPGEGPMQHVAPLTIIKRIVRTYEGEARAAEDLELLSDANPAIRYRIDQIQHIER